MNSLLDAQGRQIEGALWAAIKGLEQPAQVLQGLARDQGAKRPRLTGNLEHESARLRDHVQTLRDVLVASFRDTRGSR